MEQLLHIERYRLRDRFIDRWEDGMQEEHVEMITRYIEECKRAGGETRDNDLFATADRLLRFK